MREGERWISLALAAVVFAYGTFRIADARLRFPRRARARVTALTLAAVVALALLCLIALARG